MFDHLALRDIMPEDLRFEDTQEGVRISWVAENGNGSVLLEGVGKAELGQDDFMFADDRMLIHPAGTDATTVTATSYATIEGEDQGAENPGGDDDGSRTARFSSFLVKAGTAGDDIFQASPHHDYYVGLGGDDRLFGAFGDDDLRGDAGDDVLDGGDGADHLMGGAGDDHLFGGAMADNLMGGDGEDEIHAGGSHDMIEGGAGNDILDGGDGADAFMVGPMSGDDVVVGGFDAGPGAFDHIAFIDILPEEVTVEDATHDDREGVLVSWSMEEDGAKAGSIFLQGLSKDEMAQDDFMFDAVEGGAFVPDPAISRDGSRLIFSGNPAAEIGSRILPDLDPTPGA
jgi:Ca2+-binding RTX toxin-like protein